MRKQLRKRAAWALAFATLLAAGVAAAALEAGAAPESSQATTTITTTLTTGTTTTVATITTTTPATTTTTTTTTPVTTTVKKVKKVAVCHRTKSKKKPYVRVVVSGAALKAHLKHRLDIIPAPRTGCPKHVVPVRNHKIVKKK